MRLRYPLMAVLGLTVAIALIGLSEANKPTTTTVVTLHEPIFEPTIVVEEVIRLAVWPPDLRLTPEGDTGTGLAVDIGERPTIVCDDPYALPMQYQELCG